jgi:hypothetical protein
MPLGPIAIPLDPIAAPQRAIPLDVIASALSGIRVVGIFMAPRSPARRLCAPIPPGTLDRPLIPALGITPRTHAFPESFRIPPTRMADGGRNFMRTWSAP